MNHETAENLLWDDFRRAVDDEYYAPLSARHEALTPLADKLNLVLTALQYPLVALMRYLLTERDLRQLRSISINDAGHAVAVFNFGDHVTGKLTMSSSVVWITCEWYDVGAYLHGTDIARDTLEAADLSLDNLFAVHLATLRRKAEDVKGFWASIRTSSGRPRAQTADDIRETLDSLRNTNTLPH